eukprot:TRINITY_DN24132_c0_g1_i1.p1 TRINITY_DN24132_c0_g1~~TRINITY_DN24132_c0_g1_i1.p1  ORF type:complete len:1725 (-),score=455.23 TRINITY_DN24132_c0_g1_i1:237-5411(-)
MKGPSLNAPPKKIAAGLYHSASIGNTSDNRFLQDTDTLTYVWGRNKWRVLGLPENTAVADRPIPLEREQVPRGVYEVAAGTSHTLFLVKDPNAAGGTVYGTGLGNKGRLGVGQSDDVTPGEEEYDIWSRGPVDIFAKHPVQIARICSGSDHSLCLSVEGVLYAFGVNTDGQCGTGHSGDAHVPTAVKLPDGPTYSVEHFACGARHSLAVLSGVLYAWGCGEQGRLGVGTLQSRRTPAAVDTAAEILTAACGEAHSAAISIYKKLYIWGAGSHGRLGLNDSIDIPIPRELEISSEPVLQVALGGFHSLALIGAPRRLDKQQLFTWGVGAATGVLSEGDNSTISVPRLINISGFRDIDSPIIQIVAGTYHSMLMLQSGYLVTFGLGSNGRLGSGKNKDQYLPNVLKGSFGFSTKWAGRGGDNFQKASLYHPSEKAAGKGEVDSTAQDGQEPWALNHVGCGSAHTVAVTNAGQLYVWGSAAQGQLGQPKLYNKNPGDFWFPTLLQLPENRLVKQVAVGYEHCLAITKDGMMFAWGRSDHGQLGTGKTKTGWLPEPVPVVGRPISCAAGEEHSAVICECDGVNKLYTFGSAETGKLGLGMTAFSGDIPTPALVDAFGRDCPLQVSMAQEHTVVLVGKKGARHGRVWTCGGGWYGRLGHGDHQNQYAPKEVKELGDARSIACGSYHTCAISYEEKQSAEDLAHTVPDHAGAAATIAEPGHLFIWGRDRSCAESEHVEKPRKFLKLDGTPRISLVFCGPRHTFVVTEEKEIWVWGDNASAQLCLGSGATAEQFFPEQVKLLHGNIVCAATGPTHGIAYLDTKQTYGWGSQSCGRLGLENKRTDRIVTNPASVRSEWSSVEAMSGSMLQNAVAGTTGDDESEEEEEVKEGGKEETASKAASKPEGSDRMLQAIAGGQKLQRFSTMQMLLKQEAPESKVANLIKYQDDVEEQLKKMAKGVLALPQREQTVLRLQSDLVTSFSSNLKFLRQQPAPDIPELPVPKVGGKLGRYEELLWVLQQQPAYLASLSMAIAGNNSAEQLFYDIIAALFSELQDKRTRTLFLALLKLMIVKEVEHAKQFASVFRPSSSRVFHVFSRFVLHRSFWEVNVHPWMDSTLKNPNSLLSSAQELSQSSTVFALTKQEFKKAMQSIGGNEPGKEFNTAELSTEFNNVLKKLHEFVAGEFLTVLWRIKLDPTVAKIFLHAVSVVQERHFPELTSADRTMAAEFRVYEPCLLLLLQGLIIPIVRNTEKYASSQVHLARNPGLEPSTVHNLNVLGDFLEEMVGDKFKNHDSPPKPLVQLCTAMVPELLKYLMEQVKHAVDDVYTTVALEAYVSHFSREPHVVSVPTPKLMQLSNLLLTNCNKLRINQDDVMEMCVREIGGWSQEEIDLCTEKSFQHNLLMNNRFLLDPKWGGSMTICRLSLCPVPPRMSGQGADGDGQAVAMKKFVNDNPHKDLEEFLFAIEPVEATDFKDLGDEIQARVDECTSHGAATNFPLAHRLAEGLLKIKELVKVDASVSEVLGHMADCVVARGKHRAYLDDVQRGMFRIEEAGARYEARLKDAETELRVALRQSMRLEMPKVLREAARKEGKSLRLTVPQQKLEKIGEFGRQEYDGVSFAPMVKYTLARLMQDNVVVQIPDKSTLRNLKQTDVLITLCVSQGGADFTIALQQNGVASTLKRFRIAEDRLNELRKADKDKVVELPLGVEAPMVVCSSVNLCSLIANIVTGRKSK